MRSRRPSGSPLSYERPPPISPPPRRFSNPYEEYGPPRASPLYRDTRDRDAYYPRGANSYRPLDYYPRSPSPERRPEPPARSEPATWDRPADNGWQSKTTWDRRSLTRSPTSPVIIRPRMLSDAGSRMFEPSDAWKQSERERSASLQSPRISGPLFDRGPSPERLLRSPALSRAPAPQPLRASLSVEIPIPGFGNPHLSDPKEANQSPQSHEEELPVSATGLPDPDHSGDAWKLLDPANSSQSSAQTTPPIPNQNAELTVPTPAKAVDVDSSEKSMSDPSASASEAEPPSVDGPKVQPNGVDTPFTVEVVETVPTPAKVVPIKLLPPPLPRIPRSRTGFSLDAIPPLKDAKNIADALRTVVMTRLRDDDQTREARVEPVLQENLLFTQDEDAYPPSTKTQEQLVASISRVRFDPPRDDVFLAAKPWLLQRFRRRTDQLEVKRKELEQEYQGLHTQWRRHCDILDQQGRPMEPPGIGGAGDALPSRTTRRSAALGDTVRSDLEMEQIIASLGYDEAMDPNSLASRNLATIPDMISTTSATPFVYDDTNHRVDNPHEYYAPSTGIHDWTTSEKEVFLDAYARTPKQFGLIADQLPNKNAAQCVDYYYLHKKKIIDFRKVVAQYAPRRGRGRGGRGRGRGGGLLADIRQHDAEVYGDDDEYVARGARTARGGAPGAGTEGRRPPSTRRSSAFGLDYVETATPTPEPEEADGADGRPKRRRVSAITRVAYVADEPEEPEAEPKKRKRGRPPKPKPPPVVLEPSPVPTPPAPDVEPQSNFSQASMLWSLEDKALLLGLAKQHGPNFSRIAMMMPNKTTAQVAEYYQMLDVGKMLDDAVRKGIDDGRLGAGRALGSASRSGTSTPVTGETSTPAAPTRSAGTIVIPAQIPRTDTAGVPILRIGVMAAKPDP
ncbi:Nuclear receptor corepressor 2-like [Mycena kentingensis (nom. inval.)]|nr:Nuclear receptor corepressor 2-like [Mycena kentingensis (nom. inval.)]